MITKMDGQVIEWDDSKNELNVQKHGISFRLAMRVFYDKNRIEYHDSAHSGQEDRYIVLGLVQDILFVVYTERGDNIRLISARPATKAEKDIYYGNY